jgi:hypothetical protein
MFFSACWSASYDKLACEPGGSRLDDIEDWSESDTKIKWGREQGEEEDKNTLRESALIPHAR